MLICFSINAAALLLVLASGKHLLEMEEQDFQVP